MNSHLSPNSSRSSSLESIIFWVAHSDNALLEELGQEMDAEVAPRSRRSFYSVSPYYTESSSSDEEEEDEVEARNDRSPTRFREEVILMDRFDREALVEERNRIIEELNNLDRLIYLISHLLDGEDFSEEEIDDLGNDGDTESDNDT